MGKIVKITGQWWFWLITTIITAVIAKLIRDWTIQKNFVSGVKAVDKWIKQWLKSELDSDRVWFGLDTYQAIEHATPEQKLNVLEFGNYDLPVYLNEYKEALIRTYTLANDKNLSFIKALNKVLDEYRIGKGIWLKMEM